MVDVIEVRIRCDNLLIVDEVEPPTINRKIP
jgi:hypothetical protein